MNSLFANLSTTVKRNSLAIALTLVMPTLAITNSALAAERIYAAYSVLERSISIDALEEYAKKGILDDDLAVYAQYATPEQLAQLREVLLNPIDLSEVAVSQFLYTRQGEILLRRLGEVIKTEARQPGFYAIRSALILAAAEPEGLTLLNVLRKFPTRSIRIDLARSLQIAGELEQLVNQTNLAIAAVSQESNTEATASKAQVNLSQLPEIQRRGPYNWNRRTLTLYDVERARIFVADIYIPNIDRPAPVIVISHGLGSDRTSFQYLATQLASYGFAVAVPNHPGSDAQQLQALLAGRASEVAEPNEFINRPLDVTYLLNELDRLNKADPAFKGRFNVEQVGVIGQSFGGYTALALAGAPINFEQLDKDCSQQTLNQTWNVSLLLQCRAEDLPRQEYNLRDQRVKAAIAVNPISSSIFGQTGLSQIQIPVAIVASSDDTVAPALSEQILPFTWLTAPEKYLVLLEGGTHFSVIGASQNTEPVPIPSEVIGPSPAQARRYLTLLSLPFFKTYVAGNSRYQPYLSATYAEAISSQPLTLSVVGSLTTTQLAQALGGEIPVPTLEPTTEPELEPELESEPSP